MVATIALAFVIAPVSKELSAEQKQQTVGLTQIKHIIEARCASCHSDAPTDDVFTIAPAGIIFSDEASIVQWAPRIQARVIDAKDMPFMNKTEMTDEERTTLAIWLSNTSHQ